jgi:hypothetical protein
MLGCHGSFSLARLLFDGQSTNMPTFSGMSQLKALNDKSAI